MTNFKIEFTHPWLLLVLVLAIGFALFTYFRSGKRYRKNRNRIVSLVLHIIVTVLCVTILAGVTFSYDQPNPDNEVLLVVDVSDSGEEATQRRNEFVKSVIDKGGENFKIGVVTFGYDQVYAVPLTNDSKNIYQDYLDATLPDTSASDIASALAFAKEKIVTPQTAKIVLVSDGMQTDTNALSTIKSIVDEGITVDTAYYASDYPNDLQIVGVTLPDYNVIVGETFKVSLDVQSSFVGTATISISNIDTNNNNRSDETEFVVDVVADMQTIELEYRLPMPHLYQLNFSIQSDNDVLTNNNVYCSYLELISFDEILIVETYENEGAKLEDLLVSYEYEVTRVNVKDPTFPAELSDLRQYDQVIMANVSSKDLPAGFDKILTQYVEELGGGLFTVGGNRYKADGTVETDSYGSVVANAYNYGDNFNPNIQTEDEHPNPAYQELLPVKAEKYSPPVGVILIIDRSGSMGGDYGSETKLEWAKKGAKACIEALTSRDYVGVLTLEDYYNEDAQLTPVPRKSEVIKAIDNITLGGGTVFRVRWKEQAQHCLPTNLSKNATSY